MSDAHHRGGRWRDETFLDDLRRGARDHPDKAAVAVHRVDGDRTRVLDYADSPGSPSVARPPSLSWGSSPVTSSRSS
jgi:hypothetical protein